MPETGQRQIKWVELESDFKELQVSADRLSAKLTNKWRKDCKSSFKEVHSFKERRPYQSSFGLIGPPVVLENVFHCQPKAKEEEKRAGNGMASEVGHRYS